MGQSWCYDLVCRVSFKARGLIYSALAPAPLQVEEHFPEYDVIKVTCSPWCPPAAP